MVAPTRLRNPIRVDYLGQNSRVAERPTQISASQAYPQAYREVTSHIRQLVESLGLEPNGSGFPRGKFVLYIEERARDQKHLDKRYLCVQEETTGKKAEKTFEAIRTLTGYDTCKLLGILEQVASEARAKGGNVWRR